mgnify:CR=1 FL=1
MASLEIENSVLGKLKIYGPVVGLFLAVVTLTVVCIVAWASWVHAADAKDGARAVAAELKDANKEVAATLKESNKEVAKVLAELARAMREQNCLQSFPPEKRPANADLCKRIAQ